MASVIRETRKLREEGLEKEAALEGVVLGRVGHERGPRGRDDRVDGGMCATRSLHPGCTLEPLGELGKIPMPGSSSPNQ